MVEIDPWTTLTSTRRIRCHPSLRTILSSSPVARWTLISRISTGRQLWMSSVSKRCRSRAKQTFSMTICKRSETPLRNPLNLIRSYALGRDEARPIARAMTASLWITSWWNTTTNFSQKTTRLYSKIALISSPLSSKTNHNLQSLFRKSTMLMMTCFRCFICKHLSLKRKAFTVWSDWWLMMILTELVSLTFQMRIKKS